MANTKIPSELIADSSITAAKLADGTITTADIADSNVTTAKIADSNVTTAKIGDAQVTTAKITDANVTTGKIADDAVTTAKMASNSVTSDTLASGLTLAGNTAVTGVLTVNTNAATDVLVLRRDSSNGDSGIQFANSSGNLTVIRGSSVGNFTIDTAGGITLDADGGQVDFKDAGTLKALIDFTGSNVEIQSRVTDADILFRGQDGSSFITALTLDMSDVGTAHFNGHLRLGDNRTASFGAGYDIEITSDGTNGTIAAPNGNLTLDVTGDITLNADGGDWLFYDGSTTLGSIQNDGNNNLVLMSNTNDKDIKFLGIDNSNTITALLLDMSEAGAATFNDSVTADKYIMTGGSQIGQDYAYLKSDSTSNASLTLRKDSTGADSIDFLQLRSDGNGLIGKIEGDGDISFKNATLSGTISSGAITSSGLLTVSSSNDAFPTIASATKAIFATDNTGGFEVGLTLLGNQSSIINFGDYADEDIGQINYSHSSNSFVFKTNTTTALTLDSSQNATFAGNIIGNDIKAAGSGGLTLQTDEGTKRLIVQDNGNLLVASNSGKTSAEGSLDVAASVGVNLRLSSTYNYSPNRDWAIKTNNFGSSNWGGWSLEQSTAQQGSPSVPRIGVHSNGNVGIGAGGAAGTGTTYGVENPASKLHVNGDITIGTSSTNDSPRYLTSGGTTYIQAADSNHRIILRGTQNSSGTITGNTNTIGFYEYGGYEFIASQGQSGRNKALVINDKGTVMTGNLSSPPNYPGSLTAYRTGNSGTTTQNTWSVNATAQGNAIDFGFKTSGSGSYAVGVINHGETTWMSRLDYSGAIHLTNTTIQNISDRRLKKDIVDANSQWNDIKGLKFKNYKWKDESRGTDTYLGLIADEVESVSPGLIGIDAVTAETMPEDGIDPEYKNVKYSIVWMKAAKALQEAMARIETLEAEVKALKEG